MYYEGERGGLRGRGVGGTGVVKGLGGKGWGVGGGGQSAHLPSRPAQGRIHFPQSHGAIVPPRG